MAEPAHGVVAGYRVEHRRRDLFGHDVTRGDIDALYILQSAVPHETQVGAERHRAARHAGRASEAARRVPRLDHAQALLRGNSRKAEIDVHQGEASACLRWSAGEARGQTVNFASTSRTMPPTVSTQVTP